VQLVNESSVPDLYCMSIGPLPLYDLEVHPSNIRLKLILDIKVFMVYWFCFLTNLSKASLVLILYVSDTAY
jgi:hypothetical protein